MKIIADTHTHSLTCDHAYSTIAENLTAAAKAGLKILCSTEHTPDMPGAPSHIYFNNLRVLPRYTDGVMLVRGAEVNVLDDRGGLDLTEHELEKLEWVIASMHMTNFHPKSKAECTNAWLAIAENPRIHVIGHCGDERYAFDYEPVLREFARAGKIVEINSHSFLVRPGSKENCPKIARLCMELGIPVVVSSDAHHQSFVGRFDAALAMLEEIGFPEKLILNAEYSRFLNMLHRLNGGELSGE